MARSEVTRVTLRHGLIVAALLLACTHAGPALAWGAEGHRVVALIAQTYLQPAVRALIAKMLADDARNTLTAHDIVEASIWADRIREENADGAKHGTSQWHFVDIEITHPDEDTACFGHPALPPGQPAYPGIPKDCVIDKLVQFQDELASRDTSSAERIKALKFVLHLVGDLHQPLHAADDMDRGGNAKKVDTVEGRSENLHSFWDTTVVERLGQDTNVVATDLAAKITPDERTRWARGTPAEWARESFELGKADAYGQLPPPSPDGDYRLTDAYEATATNDAALQISKAGVRLAAVLNASLETSLAP